MSLETPVVRSLYKTMRYYSDVVIAYGCLLSQLTVKKLNLSKKLVELYTSDD
jgi:hypothetical protein